MSQEQSLVGIVLAAGQGTRMKSALPKVLHEVCERPMVSWVVQAALDAGASECVVVVGHGRDAVMSLLKDEFEDRVRFAVQEEQRGTGHAVRCAMDAALQDYQGRLLVLYGDCPALSAVTLKTLVTKSENASSGLMVATKNDPRGYGRIVRNESGVVTAIVEDRDCTPEQKEICEVNPGLYVFDAAFARDAMSRLTDDNAQGELYLTDLIAMSETPVVDLLGDMAEMMGVNDRSQLAEVEKTLRLRINIAWARSGVTIRDPFGTFIGAECVLEPDAVIEPNVHLRGKTIVHSGARVDVGCVLKDVEVHGGATLKPYTVATESSIGEAANVGPFSHLRPHTKLGPESKVGNFCETKKTTVGRGSKVNHLSYVGDGILGEGVNVGAGTIFCNYDGVQKHTTVLEDGVFIGSDSQLVAPLTVGKGAYVASGSTVTKDVPSDALAMSRTKQVNKDGYASRLRARMKAAKK